MVSCQSDNVIDAAAETESAIIQAKMIFIIFA